MVSNNLPPHQFSFERSITTLEREILFLPLYWNPNWWQLVIRNW